MENCPCLFCQSPIKSCLNFQNCLKYKAFLEAKQEDKKGGGASDNEPPKT